MGRLQGLDVAEVSGVLQQTLSQRAKAVRSLLDLDHWPPPDPYWRSDVRRRHEQFGASIEAAATRNPP